VKNRGIISHGHSERSEGSQSPQRFFALRRMTGGILRRSRKRGLSLLEVILALAILGGAIAVLGEAARLALRNAEFTRDMARAQLLCESKLAEIMAGVILAEPIQRAVIENAASPGEPNWLYSIEKASLDDEGLLSVRVTVVRDLPQEKHPVTFSLVRWIDNSQTSDTENSDSETKPPDASSGTATQNSSGGTQ
jgi:type II secretion system protein I